MIKIGPIIEIILYVKDMDAQVCFYRNILGLEVSYPQGLADFSDQMWVTFDTGNCTLALHGGGQGILGRDAPKFVFEVDDVEMIRTTLIDLGVSMSEIRTPTPGTWVCDSKDPEGNTFSIESRRK
jgi:predicted enzyme related to lactoylglutathione lyase